MLPDSKPMPSANDTQDQGADDYSKGFVIEITVKADGTMSVAAEPLAEETSEESAAQLGQAPAMGGESPDDSDSGQQVQTWQEAMQVAGDLYRNKGQLSSGSPNLRQQMYDQAPGQKP